MKTLLKLALLGGALALSAAAQAHAAGSGAHALANELKPWLQRDLGADIQRDADQYRPRLGLDVAGLEAAAAEFKAHALATSLQAWLNRDLKTAIKDETDSWLQQKYGHIEVIDAALPENLVCLAQ